MDDITRETLTRTVMQNTYQICGKRVASVPIALMEIDFDYQRLLGKTVARLKDNWDMDKCDLLMVSYRDGRFYVLNGQHRMTAAKMLGIETLPCIIFEGLTQKDEAYKFGVQQLNINRMTPYDTFKANICCGDESIPEIKLDMYIKEVCDKYGVVVKRTKSKTRRTMKVLNKARRYAAKDLEQGTNKFEWLMELINTTPTWADAPTSYTNQIFEGLSSFRSSYGNNATIMKKLPIAISRITPDELIYQATVMYPDCYIITGISNCLKDMCSKIRLKKLA